jgi:disulfide bond formation protein DsbB
VAGLGKTLVESEFVRARSDQELLEFVIAGRQPFDPENTTGILMPPRGGNPGLTDNDLLTIIAYMRTVDGFAPDGSGVTVAAAESEGSEDTPPVSTEPVVFVRPDVSALLDSQGIELEASAPTPDRDGESAYNVVCGVRYVEGFVPAPDFCDVLRRMVTEGASEDELFTLLQEGDPIWDEDNSTGVHFPARGGYPPLNDAEIDNLIENLVDLH